MQIQVSSSHKSILYIAKCVCHLYTLFILRILAPVNMGHNRLVYLVTSVKSVIIHHPTGHSNELKRRPAQACMQPDRPVRK